MTDGNEEEVLPGRIVLCDKTEGKPLIEKVVIALEKLHAGDWHVLLTRDTKGIELIDSLLGGKVGILSVLNTRVYVGGLHQVPGGYWQASAVQLAP